MGWRNTQIGIMQLSSVLHLAACDLANKVEVTKSFPVDNQAQGARAISQEEAASLDAMLTGFATAVGATNVAPLVAVSLVPIRSTITLAVENTSPLLLQNNSVKLAITILESKRGSLNLNALPIEDGGNVKISGLTTGERVKILVRIINLTSDRAQIAKDVINDARKNNVHPEQINVVAQARVSAAFAKAPEGNGTIKDKSPEITAPTTPTTNPQSPASNNTTTDSQPPASNNTTTDSQPPASNNTTTDSQPPASNNTTTDSQPPASNTTTTESKPPLSDNTSAESRPPIQPTHSILYQASGFYLSGIASNSVQSANHPVVIEAATEILDAVNSVQCSWTWGTGSQTSNTMDYCTFSRDQGKILLNLPQGIQPNQSGFGLIRVRLLNSSGDASDIKASQLYLTPSVAGLLPCTPPKILASPETLLGSPALATMAGQAFDNTTISTDILININLADKTKVLEKYSLRTSYKKLSYRDNDYIVIYKAWPAFTAQQFGSAISHNDMCRMAEEYKPMTKIKPKQGNYGRKLARFDAMVISSSGILVGVNETGQARRIADAHKKDLTRVIGAGAEKQVSENCDAQLPASDRYRAPVLCVKIQE